MSDLAKILRDDKGHKYGGKDIGYFHKTNFFGTYEFFRGSVRRIFFQNYLNLNKTKNTYSINNILCLSLRISALYHPSKSQPNRTNGCRVMLVQIFARANPVFARAGPIFARATKKIIFFKPQIYLS